MRPSLISYAAVCFGLGLDIQDTHMEKYKASMPFICQWDQPNSPCSPSRVVDANCHARIRAHLGCWCSLSLQLLVAGLLNTCYSRTLALCLQTSHLPWKQQWPPCPLLWWWASDSLRRYGSVVYRAKLRFESLAKLCDVILWMSVAVVPSDFTTALRYCWK